MKQREAVYNTKINYDEFTLGELRHLINTGRIKEQDVIDFYNNECWDCEPISLDDERLRRR